MRVKRRNRNFEVALRWLRERRPALFTAVGEIRLVSAGTLLCGHPLVKATFSVSERVVRIKNGRGRAAWFVELLAHELYHACRWDAVGKILWGDWRRHERETRRFAVRVKREFSVAGKDGQGL